MTRLTFVLTGILGPLAATTSLDQDRAYWQAAHTWKSSSPVTYYLYVVIVAFLAAILVRNYRRRTQWPVVMGGDRRGGRGT